MQKKYRIIITIVVALVLLATVAAFVVISNNQTGAKDGQTTETAVTEDEKKDKAEEVSADVIDSEYFVGYLSQKKDVCLAVEMELAGVQAVCDFYGWDLYDFLATGDVLDQAVYYVSGLANANHNMDKLYIAIEIAKRI